ncbi:DUF1707 SHOCT-like domain-containing protein [Cryptosporangium phraense]|uniref:DUF1707 domain-containing protein n=1 Tax=Cryptosporangium phraense TaxID=2593070 RepID=A0A545ASX9_9ACTN|nr:DUF1707 domain-containing protein [Cryptosporangium phraense]TQS44402.1 DUF1707 domain-containing protein [Cryptosporangium phraense]
MSQLSEPTPPVPAATGELRASNADRERVANALHEAAAEGRIDLNELDVRLNQVYGAKTYAELQPLTQDLPALGTAHQWAPAQPQAPVLPPSRQGVAIMSSFKRAGNWTVPDKFECFAFWGGGVIDLREAIFTSQTVTIRAVAIMGGIDVIAPEFATVHVSGVGVMGGFNDAATYQGAPGAPIIIVTGFAFWGGVSVKRRATRAEIERRRLERKRLKAERKAQDD